MRYNYVEAHEICRITEEGNFTASATITVKMKQEINAYIETKVVANGSNSMGVIWNIIRGFSKRGEQH